MDILGFAKLVVENDHKLELVRTSMYTTLIDLRNFLLTGDDNHSFKANIQESKEHLKKYPYPDFINEILEFNFKVFSDSIILFIEIDPTESTEVNIEKLKSICWVSNHFIAKSILFKGPLLSFPYRCAIAVGEMIIDEDNGIFLGKPLIDAVKLAECQEWMGGALHPSIPKKYYTPILGHDQELIKQSIPIDPKNSCVNELDIMDLTIALNWVKHHPSDPIIVKDLQREGPALADIGGQIRKKFKWSNGDMRGRVKGSNTLDFVQMIDEKWNESEHVEGSTIKEFSFPDWYIKGKISYNREFPSD